MRARKPGHGHALLGATGLAAECGRWSDRGFDLCLRYRRRREIGMTLGRLTLARIQIGQHIGLLDASVATGDFARFQMQFLD
jgi:hypothetical protein